MNAPIFARAKPALIEISEIYRYHALIAGNQVLEEKGKPQGEIHIEVPFDGYTCFTRPGVADVRVQHLPTSGDVNANIGFIAVSEVEPNVFWPDEPNPPSRTVLPLEVPLPGDTERLDMLLEDQYKAILKHTYQPEWPDVHPRPHPLRIEVDIYDEETFSDRFKKVPHPARWHDLTQELSFARNLFLRFKVELALPKCFAEADPPIVRLVRMEWPVATSYQMLDLYLESDGDGSIKSPDLFYLAEQGSVEWREVVCEFGPNPSRNDEHVEETLHMCHAPYMDLVLSEPGEFYYKTTPLVCRIEVELPDALLSGLEAQYFTAFGKQYPEQKIKRRTLLQADLEINLQQRFDRKVLAPIRELQFEGVKLTERRVQDVARVLRDHGFTIVTFENSNAENGPVSPYFDHTQRPDEPDYYLAGHRQEGPDQMRLMIHTWGVIGTTRRERAMRGGETFTTDVRTGVMRVDIRAELSGDIRKLSQVMDSIHLRLKELFAHTIDLS